MKKSLLSMSMLHFSLAVFLCFSLSFCGGGDDDKPPDADGDGIEDAKDNCPEGTSGAATTADPTATTADPDMDGCKNSEDDDDDNNNVPDTRDVFPHDACASVDNDKDGMPDTLVNGCTTSLTEDTDDDNDTVLDTDDVDADGDGLIEIATASELNNMRHNLAGTTYDDEMEDSTPGDMGDSTGCPAAQGTACESSSTGCCGYELVADIDLSGVDQNGSGTGNEGNFDPIGNLSSGHFTAYLEGNGYTINNLNIDITGATAGDNDANDAAFITSCQGVVSNLILADAVINGRRRVAVLCATMNGGAVRAVHIIDASIRQDNSTSVDSYTGSLVGLMEGSSSISNSIATGDISGDFAASSNEVFRGGGLVGLMEGSSSISNSIATGDISGAFGNNHFDGGSLVGDMSGGSISNSYATGDISGANAGPYGINAAGLVGDMSGGSISNSTATGDVFGAGSNGALRGGGLVGNMGGGSISNSTATGDVSGAIGGIFIGGLVGVPSASITNSYWNSEAMQIKNGTAQNPKRGVGSEADPSGVNSRTLSQIQSLKASTLMWDETNHWSGVGIDGNYPLLRYGDNPHTDSVNECEFLPDYDHVNDMNCITGGTICCGEELPNQELYRASGNLVFSNATIGTPTSSAPDFFYSVGDTTVTATYNLATGVTLTASGVEAEDGTATTNVSWNADSSGDGTTGQVTGIEANETFWLALTFQQDGVTHKVRWKFVRPMPAS